MLTIRQSNKKQDASSGSAGNGKAKKQGGKKDKAQPHKQQLECVVDCGHDHTHTRPQPQEQPPQQVSAANPLADTKAIEDEKALKRILEAGLMINGLKQLLVSAAERIELHVNHNTITPELLTELNDVATAIGITTKKLNSIKAPCCDLYTQTIHDEGDEPEEEEEEDDWCENHVTDPLANLFDS